MILRRAIDPSINLGSFYDRKRDCVSKQTIVTTEMPKLQLHGSMRCELIDGNTEKSENLLKMIGIDDDLRLNILLNLTPRTGIAQLIDHPRPTDKYTRFLYIFYADREQRLPDDPRETRNYIKSKVRDAEATHIITSISFGIDVVVILQLSNKDNTAKEIDVALEKIRARLNNSDFSSFTTDDEHVLEEIHETKAYSNLSELTKMTSLLQICQYINGSKKKSDTYRPITYTLQPIEWLYPGAHKSCPSYIPLKEYESDNLEQYLIELSNQMKKVKYSLDSNASKGSSDCHKEPLLKAQNKWQSLYKAYEELVERLKTLVLAKRSDQENASEIDEVLKHKDQTVLEENIRELMKQVNDLETIICSSNDLQQQQQFEHCEPLKPQANKDDDEHTLKRKLVTEDQQQQTLISNKKVTDNNQSKLSTEQRTESKSNRQSPSSPSSEIQISATTSPLQADEITNILLLGESGVGKSTFINAFVNYLKFETFEEAQSNEPVVLIPVSFIIATGNNFEEQIVKFGDLDSLNNEDFDHPGESVTQHCKSYIFNLDRNKGLKFRIIDTPGFGDTRGVNQDDLNMQHILEYINNLTHLNAVCFLLKPNVSQIHNFFQNCLSQILDVLGPDFRRNIIFCFTNSRSTFYTPGDTAPLLKDILKSLSTNDIPFNKNNTFCFDNESFRYLVALQKSIKFDDHDKEEYENSWLKSVRESNRLLSYVCTQLSFDPKQGKWQSIKNAELQINHMIRPMLETIRNILRNIIINDADSSNKLIELKPRTLYRSAALCFTCKRDFIRKGNFWIVRDVPHEIQKECYSCDCTSNQHMPIDYQLDYTCWDKTSNCNRNEMKENLNLLCNASIAFAHFLMYVVRSSKDDPFWIGITQMISEENDICKSHKPNEMNLQLAEDLREFLHKYEQRVDNMKPNQQHNKLSDIYELIRTVCELPMVQIQMIAVRETQEEIMKLYEYRVPENLDSTTIRSTTS